MLPEQQHTLGYFIEEAKDHLNTIEQGLLNLPNTLNEPGMVDKVFRAAHSLQAGAAMLEINSIQQIAHHLEDYFNVLKECPTIQVDQKLESLFLRVFDTLQELFEQFQGSFHLPEDVASKMMSEVEPVLEALNQHLRLLVNATYIFDSLFDEEDTPLNLATEEPVGDLFDTLDESEDSFDFEEDWGLGVRDWELREDWLATETFTSLPEPEATAATGNEEWMDLSIDLFDISMPLDNKSDASMDIEAMWEETSFAYEDSATDLGEIQTAGEISKDLEGFAELEALLLEDEFSLEALFDMDTPTIVPVTQAPTLLTIPDASAGVSTQVVDEFADLEELLEETILANAYEEEDEFSQLEALLDVDTPTIVPATQAAALSTIPNLTIGASTHVDDEFADLDELLEKAPFATSANYQEEDEFSQLEALLDVDTPTIVPATQAAASTEQNIKSADLPRRAAFERTMRVPVKHLDNVSNLVGELVVNRNSLEQDQERLRQFLGNLLHQVQQLSDVGSRMQELYERSLMEASLINMRQGRSASVDKSAASLKNHATGIDFDDLEMDRFTGFHTLSQEMIELIVRVREASSDVEFVADETDQVARQFRQVTTQLQEGLTRSRMVPFAQIAERMPRAVRDIALKYNKQAQLHIVGQETLIDKMILEQLYDPMTHLVNNSITHGIETPEERSAQGKLSVGQITIRAFYQGNQIVISVADDGAGIDAELVKAKAIQKRLISPDDAETMSRLDVYNLLFHPGFSTKDQVDEFSGRGVGMDVVRTSLSEIRGTINTDSTLGLGTTFTIRLPLTLSICKALCCLSDKAQIAFPMDGVEDMMDVSVKSVVSNEEGQSFITWRDLLLRFQPLKELLKYNRQLGRGNVYGSNREDDMISIVVLRSANKFLAIQVDQVLGEQEIVIKQLEGPAPKPVGVAGATVLGDGRIMPIADVLELIDLSMGRLQSVRGTSSVWAQNAASVALEKSEPTVLIVDDSITVRELLSITFNKAGYRVEQARDGQEAWDKLRDGLPCDIVFCDIEMPRMDGLELLSRMQKDINLSHLPIAMLTSRGADRHRQMAIQLGASGYFIKPYLEEALLDGAQRMLRGEVLVTSNV